MNLYQRFAAVRKHSYFILQILFSALFLFSMCRGDLAHALIALGMECSIKLNEILSKLNNKYTNDTTKN